MERVPAMELEEWSLDGEGRHITPMRLERSPASLVVVARAPVHDVPKNKNSKENADVM